MQDRNDWAIEELDEFSTPLTWGDVKRKVSLLIAWWSLP